MLTKPKWAAPPQRGPPPLTARRVGRDLSLVTVDQQAPMPVVKLLLRSHSTHASTDTPIDFSADVPRWTELTIVGVVDCGPVRPINIEQRLIGRLDC